MPYNIAHGAYTLLERRVAISGGLDVKKAVRHLREDAHLCSVRETLMRCSDMEAENAAELKESIKLLLKENDPGINEEAIDADVSNWIADDVQAIDKDNAIRLAYALHMPIDYTDAWLTRLCGETFHWRNPEDIVWVFGLINGLSYAEASELKQRLEEKEKLFEDRPAEAGRANKPKDRKKKESENAMTDVIRQEVVQLRTEAELEEFFDSYRGQLGKMHNTAYEVFCKLMNLLQNPGDYSKVSMSKEQIKKNKEDKKKYGEEYQDDLFPEDKKMTVRNVVMEYLYREYIPRANRKGKGSTDIGNAVRSAIQRSIARNWPDETTLSKMKNRKIDVTRKVLILLFLATDGGVSENEYEDDAFNEYEDIDADEDFESMEMRMNLMLAQCGFAQLDSRTPFDWMVLYCMYADESIFIENNMRSFLENVFTGEGSTALSK